MYDKFVEMTLLSDIYGKILTEKQQEIMDLYYMKDLSLGEIAELLKISRQAVHDNLKRAERQLRQMEDRLGLMERFLSEKEGWAEIIERMDGVISLLRQRGVNGEVASELEDIRGFICSILGG